MICLTAKATDQYQFIFGRPRPDRSYLVISVAAAVLVMATGCATPPKFSDENVSRAADYLESIAMHAERYGAATMSTPLLLDGANQTFDFTLNKTADSYFEDARSRVQGVAAVSEQSFLSVAASASYSADPTQKAAYDSALEQYRLDVSRIRQRNAIQDAAAYQDYLSSVTAATKESDPAKRRQALANAERTYASALSGPSTDKPTPPTAANFAPPAADTTAPKQADPGDLMSKSFLAPGSLAKSVFPNEALSITNRSAIITAAGDTTVAGIFKALGQPQKAIGFTDKRAFFGVAMVAVTPGHKTRQGFAAELSITTEVSLRLATPATTLRLLERPDLDPEWKKAVLHGMGMQLMDLSSRTRNQMLDTLAARERLKANPAEYRCPAGPATLNSELREKLKTVQSALAFVIASPIDNPQKACDALAATSGSIGDPGHSLVAPIPLALQGGDLRLPANLGLTIRDAEDCGATKCYSFDARYSPAVAAVSPMTETQVIDEASSSRSRKQVALALAAAMQSAGQKEQANVFAQYAKQVEADVLTRTPQNLVTGYSSGSTFGYQIGPALEALENPSGTQAKSREVLQRQSFPILLIFGVDNVNSGPKIYKSSCGGSNDDCLQVWQPYLRLRQQVRWVPTRRVWIPVRWKRESEETAARYAAAIAGINYLCARDSSRESAPGGAEQQLETSASCAYMRGRAKFLTSIFNQQSSEIELPDLYGHPGRVAEVMSIIPSSLPKLAANESRTLFLLGKNLDIAKSPTLVGDQSIATFGDLTHYGDGAASVTLTAAKAMTPPIAIRISSDDGLGVAANVLLPAIAEQAQPVAAPVPENKAKKPALPKTVPKGAKTSDAEKQSEVPAKVEANTPEGVQPGTSAGESPPAKIP